MSTHSFFIKSINKALIFGFFIAALFVTNGLNGQQNIGPYNIMLKDGWKHNNAKSDVSEHYFFEKDGLTVAIPKSPQEAPAGVNSFILDYANKLKGTDEFIEQQKQSVPVALYGKSQSARLTIKSKSTGVRRFVYLTMVDNKVYETLMQDNNNGTDPNGNIIQFLSQVSVDQNAVNKTYADDTQYRTASEITPSQFPTNPGDGQVVGGTIALPSPQLEIKIAIIKEITAYIHQFDNTCFGKAIKLGDPVKFSSEIDKNIKYFYVGDEGKKRLKETGKGDPMGRHYTWKDPGFSAKIGLTADLIFPFDPRDIPAGKDGDEKRKTLMHEMTHHIEWLAGVKEGSNDKNLFSERNTNYQDEVINRLKQELVAIEKILSDGKSNIPDVLDRFRVFENNLHNLENGSAASYNPPDKNLKTMTGFNAQYNLIEEHYLSGDCGPKLKNLVMLYRLLWRINRELEFEPVTINLGEEVISKAFLQYKINEDERKQKLNNLKGIYRELEIKRQEEEDNRKYKLEIPEELKPVFSWKLPDGSIIIGNPLKFKPEEEGQFNINVKLSVTFEKESLDIAEGILAVTVQPNEKESKIHNSSIKIAEKVNATDLIEVEVLVSNDVKSKIVEYEWSPCASGPDKNTAKTKIQFINSGDKPLSSNVSVWGKDASGNSITTVEKKVTVIPVIFPAPNLISEGQESSSGPWGAHVNGLFKEQKREGHVPAKVYVALDVSWCNSDCTKKYDDWENEMQKNPNLKRKMIALDDFQGFMYQSDFKRDCRGSGYVDLGYLDCNVSGKGFVVKGCLGIHFEYNVYSTGVIEGEGSGFCNFEKISHDDSEFLKATALEAQQKVLSYLEGIKLTPKP